MALNVQPFTTFFCGVPSGLRSTVPSGWYLLLVLEYWEPINAACSSGRGVEDVLHPSPQSPESWSHSRKDHHHHLHMVRRRAWVTAVDIDAIDKGMFDGVLA